MKYTVLRIWMCLFVIHIGFFQTNAQNEECTIGVAAGIATSDGRPLLWKSRDKSLSNNFIKKETGLKYSFIYVTDTDRPSFSRMGVNEAGFAMVNSTSEDLAERISDPINAEVIKHALGNFKTVDEFEAYLMQTNAKGRTTQSNYGVIDATGAAAIFETGETVYYRFHASDSDNGYIVRTNFSFNGGGSSGKNRYNRSTKLINDFYKGDSLSFRSIIRHQMRDFSDSKSRPIAVPYENNWTADTPYGYINTGSSICRTYTVSTVTIHGVLADENPQLTTMWTMLGHPATTAATPYWAIGSVPMVSAGTPKSLLCSEANIIRNSLYDLKDKQQFLNSFKVNDGKDGGVFPYLFHIEDSIFDVTDKFLTQLGQMDNPPIELMSEIQNQLALDLLYKLKTYNSNFNQADELSNFKENFKLYTSRLKDRVFIENYLHKDFRINIYDMQGRLIIDSAIHFGLNNIDVNMLNKGVYIYMVFDGQNRAVGKIVI